MSSRLDGAAFSKDDDKGMTLVEQIIGRFLYAGETEEEAYAEWKQQLREECDRLLGTDA